MELIKALRPKQWTKNLLIFAVPISAGKVFDQKILLDCTIIFILFCAASSAIYLYNDILDQEFDKRHPIKSRRPIALGTISVRTAYITMVLILATYLPIAYIFSVSIFKLLVIFFLFQILYIFKFKNIILVDLFVISLIFTLRAIAGGLATNLYISPWFLTVTFSIALFIICSKRYSELLNTKGKETRKVLRTYTAYYLNVILQVSLTCTIVFYVLWAIEMSVQPHNQFALFSVIPFALLLFSILKLTQKGGLEFPEDIVLRDKNILFYGLFWIIFFMLRFISVAL